MKFRYLLILLVVTGLFVSVVAFVIFDARRIFGPLDNPNLEKMQWSKLRFQYYVIEETSGPRISRTMELIDKKEINEIKGMMSTKGVGPNSMGLRDESHIVMNNGEVWNVYFAFEDRFYVCKNAERYYSYIYQLNDNRMYDRIRFHCLENERKRHLSAVIANIILRANLTDEAYKILGGPTKGDESHVGEG